MAQPEEVVKSFIEKVEDLHEAEYGDFKRKVGLYVHRMAEQLNGELNNVVKDLDEMMIKVVYQPTGDVEATRQYALDKAKTILSKVSRSN